MVLWSIVGTSEVEECWNCGKTHLKKTIAIVNSDGEVRFVGSECCKKLTGINSSRAMKKADELQRVQNHQLEMDNWSMVTDSSSYPTFRSLYASKDIEAVREAFEAVVIESKVERSEIIRQISLRWSAKFAELLK